MSKNTGTKYLKNIDGEKALNLSDLVQAGQGQVVSRTLAQNPHVSITLFAFDKDEEISSHSSTGDAMITALEGEARITIGEEDHVLSQGQTIVMPAEIPHAVFALSRFKMILTVVFPQP
ncbi:MAG: cupin domain-containing protein [Christensenellales bacterium]|jgi:quercetin dioxygenase-like cupin family protein